MVCAFTGHRPQKLPWGSDEQDPRCLALKTMLESKLLEAYGMGCRVFLCGMAQGCDLYFAEAVLQLRQMDPQVRLMAVLPYPDQTKNWPQEDRLRHKALCARCDGVEAVEPAYTSDCMQNRNRVMVERAQVLISVYDGSPSGTGSTVRYAKRLGLTILPVWL